MPCEDPEGQKEQAGVNAEVVGFLQGYPQHLLGILAKFPLDFRHVVCEMIGSATYQEPPSRHAVHEHLNSCRASNQISAEKILSTGFCENCIQSASGPKARILVSMWSFGLSNFPKPGLSLRRLFSPPCTWGSWNLRIFGVDVLLRLEGLWLSWAVCQKSQTLAPDLGAPPRILQLRVSEQQPLNKLSGNKRRLPPKTW